MVELTKNTQINTAQCTTKESIVALSTALVRISGKALAIHIADSAENA